jgi:hypothetical protein
MSNTIDRPDSTIDQSVRALAGVASKPSLVALAYALRHPEIWPEQYARVGWHFADCCACAMGLAGAIWPTDFRFTNDGYPEDGYFSATRRVFGLSRADTGRLFSTGYDNVFPVEPFNVADAIDAHLASL